MHDLHVGVFMGGRAVRDDERTQVSWLEKRSGGDECALRISEH